MDIAAFANQWLMNVSTDQTPYDVVAVEVWITLWVELARPHAGRKIRPDSPKTKQMLIEFGASLRSDRDLLHTRSDRFTLERFGLLLGLRASRLSGGRPGRGRHWR
jgi:hypothetical protein